MPSSLPQTLDTELRARGGVTLGLGPFLRRRFGDIDLRGALAARLEAALDAGDTEDAETCLRLDASAGGVLPPAALTLAARLPALAPWVMRAAISRASGSERDALLEALADPEALAPEAAALASAYAQDADHPDADVAWRAPLATLLHPPQPTALPEPREARRVGRNDACPCGSGQKYKRCCLGSGEPPVPTPRADAPGCPGITPAELFLFREHEPRVAELCQARLADGGPRPGETLYWPLPEAPSDELELRAAVAGGDPDALAEVLTLGWRRGALEARDVERVLRRHVPVASWLKAAPADLYRQLPEAMSELLLVAGRHSAADVVRLSDDRAAALRFAEAAVEGASTQADLPWAAAALAQAGETRLAFLLVRLALHGDAADDARGDLVHRLDALLSPAFGRTAIARQPSAAAADPRAAELARLMQQVAGLERENKRLRDALEAEHALRKRAETAWSESRRTDGSTEALRIEMKRLKDELKQQHDQRREAERRLDELRERERTRLLRRSQGLDDVATVIESSTNETAEALQAAAAPRPISYSHDFESAAQRLADSTIARVRVQVEQLAGGKWVREAKRMEGCDGVWTLRAGLHHRALIRDHGDRLEVFDLIAREELDNVLARLRS